MSSPTHGFDQHLAKFADQTVLCVGDLMLDEFHYGSVTRISPEAPTPVIAVQRHETMVGGAGNVARNIVSLGARCVGRRGWIIAGALAFTALGLAMISRFQYTTVVVTIRATDLSDPAIGPATARTGFGSLVSAAKARMLACE